MEEIKAGDVMLNNWVEYDGKYYQISALSEEYPFLNTDAFGVGVVTYRNIKGIPLTDDILLKAGFEKRNTRQPTYRLDTIELTNVEFWDEDSDGNEFSFKEWKLSELYHSDLFYYKSFPSINYLHQLQNLFKSLTGNDLKIEV